MKKNSSRSVEMKATAYERNAGVMNAAGRTVVPGSDYQAVVGLDVGDRKTHYCILDLDGDLVVEGGVATGTRTAAATWGLGDLLAEEARQFCWKNRGSVRGCDVIGRTFRDPGLTC